MRNASPSGKAIASLIRHSEVPIFEILLNGSDHAEPSSDDRVCVYYDGRVEGVQGLVGIINRYLALLSTLEARLRLAQQDSMKDHPKAASLLATAQDKDARRIDELDLRKDERSTV